MMSIDKIRELLGDQADALLNHTSTAITKDSLAILPSGNFVTESFTESNRSIQVMNSLQRLYGTGRLANTGYLSILPIDQGIEHSTVKSITTSKSEVCWDGSALSATFSGPMPQTAPTSSPI